MGENELKLVVGADGSLNIPGLAEIKKKLSENLKSGILAALPEEYFNSQVDACFEQMTEPRKIGMRGDERCHDCRNSSYNKKIVCPHITKDGPSEIQEMILDQMRERVRVLTKEWADKWAKDGLDDKTMIKAWKVVANKAASTYMSDIGNTIAKNALNMFRAQNTNCVSCGRTCTIDTACLCGNWVA
jgi:hypothetical protein